MPSRSEARCVDCGRAIDVDPGRFLRRLSCPSDDHHLVLLAVPLPRDLVGDGPPVLGLEIGVAEPATRTAA